MSAYYKMETIEHFAKISLVARMLGGEHLISRDEVERLQGLRGMYGIAAPAPLCADPAEADGRTIRCCVRCSKRRNRQPNASCPDVGSARAASSGRAGTGKFG